MKNRKRLASGLIILLLLVAATATVVLAQGRSDLVPVRAATARLRAPQAAQAAGYDLVPGLDHCFDNPGAGAMGFHYIDVEALDTTLEPAHPEAIVYAPMANDRLKLAAVEYIVPAGAWDAEGHDGLPSLYDQTFHLNEALGVYVLHAWIWMPNPTGLFEDWNPRVSCP